MVGGEREIFENFESADRPECSLPLSLILSLLFDIRGVIQNRLLIIS